MSPCLMQLVATWVVVLHLCTSIGTRQLLDDTNVPTESPTYSPTVYTMDCCERTNGLLYRSIDCDDKDTAIILNAVQEYLMDPPNDCSNATNCAYSSNTNSDTEPETHKCLIAWSLLQQYYNECPQLVDTAQTNSDRMVLNPIIYSMFNEHCDSCYGKYIEHGAQCYGLCDLEYDPCGVCTMVRCIGNINNLDSEMYSAGALAVWQRSLLLATAGILGCICCWGICYLSCSGSNSWINQLLRRNNNANMMQQVVSNDSD
eukprot:242993_1